MQAKEVGGWKCVIVTSGRSRLTCRLGGSKLLPLGAGSAGGLRQVRKAGAARSRALPCHAALSWFGRKGVVFTVYPPLLCAAPHSPVPHCSARSYR